MAARFPEAREGGCVKVIEALSPELEEQIADFADGWATGPERVDWEDLLYRMESHLEIDLPSDYMHPVIKRIKAIVRRVRKEAREDG